MPPPAAKRARTEPTAETSILAKGWEGLRVSTPVDLASTSAPGHRQIPALITEHVAVLNGVKSGFCAGVHEVAAVGLGLAAAANIRAGGDAAGQWSMCMTVCRSLLKDGDGAVRHAAAMSIAGLKSPPLTGHLKPELRVIANNLAIAAASDTDGDVRAAATKALSSALSQTASDDGGEHVDFALPLLTAALEVLTARVAAEPLVSVRQVVLKAIGKLGGELCQAISVDAQCFRMASPAAPPAAYKGVDAAVAALGAATRAVVARLPVEDSADWRAALPGVLSELQLPAGAAGQDKVEFAPELCKLLSHPHEGVSRTAAASLITLTQSVSTGEGGCGSQILSSLAAGLAMDTGTSAGGRTTIMAVLAVVQEAFGETKWSFSGGGLWIQGEEQKAAEDNEPSEGGSELAEVTSALGVACVSCLMLGDGEPAQEDEIAEGGDDDNDEDDAASDAQRMAVVRSAATHAVASIGKHLLDAPGGTVFCDALRAVLACDGSHHRISGLEAIGRLGPPGAEEFGSDVLSALSDDEPQVRWTAAVGAGQLLQSPPTEEEDAEEDGAAAAKGGEAVVVPGELRDVGVEALQSVMENEEEAVLVRVAAQEALELLMGGGDEDADEDGGADANRDGEDEDEDDDEEDDDEDDDEEEDGDEDEDEDSAAERRVRALQQRVRPHPPTRLRDLLLLQEDHEQEALAVQPPPRDSKISVQLTAQCDSIIGSSSLLTPIDTAVVSKDEFEEVYRMTPQVLQSVTEGWEAQQHWASAEALLDRWGEGTRFRVADDEANEPVLMRLGDYVRYASTAATQEANPLYLFDMRHLDKDEAARSSAAGSDEIFGDQEDLVLPGVRISDYDPRPHYFSGEDVFTALPSEQRPPHRWVLVGCEGSGSAIHKDPLHSSAWNTSLVGRKRWVLFPPETPRYHVFPRRIEELHPSRLKGPAAWFAHVYPKCKALDWRAPAPIEVIQEAGETMYVPAGWWHVVINLDPLSVAVTENFGSPRDFLHIRAALIAKRKDVDVDAWEKKCRDLWGEKIPAIPAQLK